MARVFISYSSKDRDRARELRSTLARDGGHQVFLDHDIGGGLRVGEEWKRRLHHELRRADAVVCLVSENFTASPWCAAEVGIADSLGCRIIPLRLDDSSPHPLLEGLQYAEGDQADERLLLALRALDLQGRTSWRDGANPFPGLAAFGADSAPTFFGREQETRQLAGRLRASAPGTALTVLTGPSGCGKSSLLKAGLLPLLEAEPGWLALAPLLPGTDPVAALAQRLASLGRRISAGREGTGRDWTVAAVERTLQEETGLAALVRELLAEAGEDGGNRRLLIAVDQAEQLFTRTGRRQRDHFLRLLRLAALDTPVRTVATARAEFLDRLRAGPGLAGAAIATELVEPLSAEMLRTVIEGPARLAGLRVGPELVAALVTDTGSGRALPLLAYTLHLLAEGRERGRELSLDDYRRTGGVRGALVNRADAALEAAATASGLPPEEVLAGLTRLATVDGTGGTLFVSRPVRRGDFPAGVARAVDVLVEHRLLAVDGAGDEQWVEVAHEALFTAWTPLWKALEERAEELRAAHAVELAAVNWLRAGEPESYLWDAARLAAVRRSEDLGPTADAERFLRESRHHAGAAARRRRRTVLAVITTLSVLLVAAVSAAGYAYVQRDQALSLQRVAVARSLDTQAQALMSTDPRTALRLAAAARRVAPGDETEAVLRAAAGASGLLPVGSPFHAHDGLVMAVALSRDGRMLATGAYDEVRLWDLSRPARPRPIGGPLAYGVSWAQSMAFSPDGRQLATVSRDGGFAVWDLGRRDRPRRLDVPRAAAARKATAVLFSPDGRRLAVGSEGEGVRLWRTRGAAAAPMPTGVWLTGPRTVREMAFSPDGKSLATGSRDGDVVLWHLDRPAHPVRLAEADYSNGVMGVAFSADGERFAAVGYQGLTRVWDTTRRPAPRLMGRWKTAGPVRTVLAVAFAPGDHTLTTAGWDGTVSRRNLPAGGADTGARVLGRFATPAEAQVTKAMALSADGQTLVTGNYGGAVELWRAAESVRPLSDRLKLPAGDDYALSPDGRTLAVTDDSVGARLWDIGDRGHPRPLGGLLPGTAPDGDRSDAVDTVSFSADGRTVLWTDGERQRVWDITRRTVPRVLHVGVGLGGQGFAATVRPDGTGLAIVGTELWAEGGAAHPLPGAPSPAAAAFSPDATVLALGGDDGRLRLYDIDDPAHPRLLGSPHTGHSEPVTQVAFDPSGRFLATGSDGDRTVRLWDLEDPAAPSGVPLPGQTARPTSVAFAPDGRTLVAGGDDGSVRLWDLTSPEHPHPVGPPLTGPDASVDTLAFTPGGRTLLGYDGYDETVRSFDLGGLRRFRDDPGGQVCDLLGSGLDPAQWRRYVPDLPYEKSC